MKSGSGLVGWFAVVLIQQFFLPSDGAVTGHKITKNDIQGAVSSPPVQLYRLDDHVAVDNGLINVTFSVPNGMITGIKYNGIENLLEDDNEEDHRGYWDTDWNTPEHPSDIYDKVNGTSFQVILENENQVELSFTTTWNSSLNITVLPVNIDKRYIVLRGSPGFYSYAVFERPEGWPDINLYQGRIVFRLKPSLFIFMAVSDERQRIMPTAQDRLTGQPLAFKEAVLLTNPSNPELRGEVDDKYQYSSDNKVGRVHGWICSDPPTGFWMITPSNEFKIGGPTKQDLTSHTGPIVLSMFFSTHYAGEPLGIKFRDGEPWKKVFGPVFIYLNSISPEDDPLLLWADAKEQMLIETESWPYDFPVSEDYPPSDQRGTVAGRLLVNDSYVNKALFTANSAYVGLALPGEVRSWQLENKGYQFWAQADDEGYFLIKNVRPGNYSLYAWVPGFIGDYKYDIYLTIAPGSVIRLGNLVYQPPRNGPTLWEIGIPDRTAGEFYVPDPNPRLLNKLYVVYYAEKFRQYGLWDRYADLYPEQDLVYDVDNNDYRSDWFFAQVTRNIGNQTYIPTTWKIVFNLEDFDDAGNYTLQLALASATEAELQVRINNPEIVEPLFTTGLIGKDNTIARHGIHGLYWLYSVFVPGFQLVDGSNTIYLTQSRGFSPWKNIMYDYIRFEGPPSSN